MPVYNTEKYLKEALDSLIRQTYENFELIIINDGSTDGSQEIIDHYVKLDKRLISIKQKNKGVVIASNKGASLAKGTYIMRTDSDDVSFDNKLLDLAAIAQSNPNAVLISGNIEVIDEDGLHVFRHLVSPFSADIKRAFFFRNPLPNGATLIKKTAFDQVGGYSDVFAEDCDLWIKLLPYGDFLGTGTFVYKWRLNTNGLTLSNNSMSIQKEKEYTNRAWSIIEPALSSRSEIMKHNDYFLRRYPLIGVDYKLAYMNDLARVSIHLIKRGQVQKGVRQLISIASTGRAGLNTVIRRFIFITQGAVNRQTTARKGQPKDNN